MAFLTYIARVVLSTLAQPAVRDAFTTAGKYAVRQATIAVVRHIRSQTNIRKTVQSIH